MKYFDYQRGKIRRNQQMRRYTEAPGAQLINGIRSYYMNIKNDENGQNCVAM